MKFHRIAPLVAAILLAPGILRCEPIDGARPAAAPKSAAPTEVATPVPAPAPAPPPAAASTPATEGRGASPAEEPGARYASEEYALGAENDDDTYDDDDPAALTDFRGALDPHGTWSDDPTYGTVWTPSPVEVGADFTPYLSAGHWAYDDDWVWVSDYTWGWAPFHYGRWVFIDGRGWCWIPGRVYRGAWVQWGADDGLSYVGWAPLPPSFVWFGGVAAILPIYVGPRWTYCPRGDIFAPGLRGHVVAGGAVGPVAMRVRPYVPATPGVVPAGPAPQKLGFQAAQIPHATGGDAGTVARARAFAQPKSAAVYGARPPTHLTFERSAPMSTETAVPASPLPPAARFPSPTAIQPPSRMPPATPLPSRASAAPTPHGLTGPAATPAAPRAVPVTAPAAHPVHVPPTFRAGGGRHH